MSLRHICVWPGCEYEIDPRLGVCYYHWLRLPRPLREATRDSYNPEWSVQPAAHRQAVKAAHDWIKEKIFTTVEPTVKRIGRSAPPPTVKRVGRTR